MARRHFRIRFPASQQPRLFAELTQYAVLELSESGASVRHVHGEPALGNATAVRIVLRSGVKILAKATLLRQDDDRLILEFDQHLPLQPIIAEQTRLAAKFPKAALTAK